MAVVAGFWRRETIPFMLSSSSEFGGRVGGGRQTGATKFHTIALPATPMRGGCDASKQVRGLGRSAARECVRKDNFARLLPGHAAGGGAKAAVRDARLPDCRCCAKPLPCRRLWKTVPRGVKS